MRSGGWFVQRGMNRFAVEGADSTLYTLCSTLWLSRYTRGMIFRKSVGALFALFFVMGAGVARAQFGVYGSYSATRLSGMTCLDPQGLCSSPNGKVNTTGGWGGVFYDFKSYGPVRFGVDLRGGEGHSNKSAVSSAGGADATATQNVMGGVRASFHTPFRILKPYVEGAAGWGRSNVTEPFGTTTSANSIVPPRQYDHFLEYAGYAGLDVKIFSIMDLRLVELGIGNMNRLGSGNGASSVGTMSAGVGIVFHLP